MNEVPDNEELIDEVRDDVVENGSRPDAEQEAQPITEEEGFKDRWKRALADLDNMRKRTQREMDLLRKFSSEFLILDILRSMEDLERAVDNNVSEVSKDNLVEGIRMVLADLKNTLERSGVSVIETVGADFNPAIHEVVMQECADCQEDNEKIVEELQRGYKLHDKVIKHAKVKVIKFTEKEE